MPFNTITDWSGEPGSRQLSIPRAGAAALTVMVYTRRGLVVVVESGTIEIVGTLRGARVTTTAGLRSDDPSSRIETAYGRPGALDGLQALNVWGYPTRGLAVLVLNERVQAVWSGRVTPR